MLRKYDDIKEAIKTLKSSKQFVRNLFYCLNCRKKQKIETWGFQIQRKKNFKVRYQSVQFLIVKNQDLSKSKKPDDY